MYKLFFEVCMIMNSQGAVECDVITGHETVIEMRKGSNAAVWSKLVSETKRKTAAEARVMPRALYNCMIDGVVLETMMQERAPDVTHVKAACVETTAGIGERAELAMVKMEFLND